MTVFLEYILIDLLRQRICAFFFLLDIAKLLSKMLIPIYTATSNVWEPSLPQVLVNTSSLDLIICELMDINHYLMVLICITLFIKFNIIFKEPLSFPLLSIIRFYSSHSFIVYSFYWFIETYGCIYMYVYNSNVYIP